MAENVTFTWTSSAIFQYFVKMSLSSNTHTFVPAVAESCTEPSRRFLPPPRSRPEGATSDQGHHDAGSPELQLQTSMNFAGPDSSKRLRPRMTVSFFSKMRSDTRSTCCFRTTNSTKDETNDSPDNFI